MIAVGAGSIFCSFFGCIPLTASFSRSSVLSASGGKTQFASLFNGIAFFFFFLTILSSSLNLNSY
jgi:MFS superfamily sulfate permease-like transporter